MARCTVYLDEGWVPVAYPISLQRVATFGPRGDVWACGKFGLLLRARRTSGRVAGKGLDIEPNTCRHVFGCCSKWNNNRSSVDNDAALLVGNREIVAGNVKAHPTGKSSSPSVSGLDLL
jgi:hypothetical protein